MKPYHVINPSANLPAMEEYKEELARILNLLRAHSRGLTITEISRHIGINRNSVAKYLDVLLTSGHIEAKTVGPARIFYLSQRVPLSAMLNLSNDYLLVLTRDSRVMYANEYMLRFEGLERGDVLGKQVVDLPLRIFSGTGLLPFVRSFSGGTEAALRVEVGDGEGPRLFHVSLIPTTFEDGSPGITLRAEDRTDQVRQQKTLEMSEARYRAVVEDQTELICRFRPDGTHVFVNEAYCRYFGLLREDLIGHRFIPLIPGEDRKMVAAHLASLSPDHPVDAIEHRIVMPNSDVRWQRWIDRAIFDQQGRILEYQSVGRDTTDRKMAEKHLQDRVKELQVLYHISEVIESGEEDLPAIMASIARLLPNAMQFPELAVARITLKDGEYVSGPFPPTPWSTRREIQVCGQPDGAVEISYREHPPVPDDGLFSDEEKALMAAVAERIGRISERFRALTALREQVHRVSELLDRIPMPVYVRSREGLYLGVNRAFEEFSGRSRTELLGHRAHDVWPAGMAAHYDAIARRVIDSGETHVEEYVLPNAHGEDRRGIFTRAPFYGKDGTIQGIVATIQDITLQTKVP